MFLLNDLPRELTFLTSIIDIVSGRSPRASIWLQQLTFWHKSAVINSPFVGRARDCVLAQATRGVSSYSLSFSPPPLPANCSSSGKAAIYRFARDVTLWVTSSSQTVSYPWRVINVTRDAYWYFQSRAATRILLTMTTCIFNYRKRGEKGEVKIPYCVLKFVHEISEERVSILWNLIRKHKTAVDDMAPAKM